MEKGEGDRLGRGKGEGRGGEQRRRVVPRFIALERSLNGQDMSQKVKKNSEEGHNHRHITPTVGRGTTPHPTYAKFHAFYVSLTHFRLTRAIPPAVFVRNFAVNVIVM